MLFDLVSFFLKRQKLVQAANGVETQVIDGKVEIENGNVPEDKPSEAPQNDTISPFHIPRMYSNVFERHGSKRHNTNKQMTDSPRCCWRPVSRSLSLVCVSASGGIGSKLKWLLSWPLLLLLYLTVPNCAKARWEKFFMVSFILSTVWIAVFSYFMVWMVSEM